jgi:hypothetical protein
VNEIEPRTSSGLVKINKPDIIAFSAYSTAGQSISASTQTVMQYNNENFDTHDCYDTSTYRFTPTVAGIYYLHASTRVNSASDQEIYDLEIRKNGTRTHRHSGNQYRYTSIHVSGLVEANGVDDYFDVTVYLGSALSLRNTAIENVFEGYFIRGAV